MLNGKLKYLFFIFIFAVYSCNLFNGPGKIPIARVDQKVLYLSEIQNIIPIGISSEDSLLYAEYYIKKWISTELLIKKAQENLNISQRDLAKEMEEYRNSLIIYRYQRELMEEKLDTNVSMEETSEYYDAGQDNFRLSSDMVKAIFIKIPLRVAQPERAKAFCESSSKQNLKELHEFCRKYKGDYKLFTEKWTDARKIFQNMPGQPEDIAGFLKQHTTWETRDTGFYYLISIQDYCQAGSVAPLDYVQDDIKEIIINKRKNDFLKKVEDDIYTEGLRNNKFKIYEYETN